MTMNSVTHKIASLAMAFLVLFATMSFTVDMHYCGDHLVDFSLDRHTQGCMMAKMEAKSASCDTMAMKMDCCSDVQIVVEGQDDLNIQYGQFDFEQMPVIVAVLYSYFERFEGFDGNTHYFQDHSPPPLTRDVQVLHQTFLI